MIRRVRIRNFKGHADTELDLGRLTVLVGDNASGKTSVLEALSLLSAIGNGPASVLTGDLYPAEFVRRGSNGDVVFDARGDSPGDWTTSATLAEAPVKEGNVPEWTVTLTGTNAGAPFKAQTNVSEGGGNVNTGWESVRATFGRAGVYHLLPERIAAVAHSNQANVAIEEDGTNTAVVLAAMKLGDDENFDRVELATCRLIPIIKRIRIQRTPMHKGGGAPIGHRIHFDFRGTPNVPAHGASHGTLVVLALLTILYSKNRPNLVLLDDLDHALHPRAQMELIKLLKELLGLPEFRDLQIVATTHSPYILDQLDPADVCAFALRENGTVATKRLSEHPAAAASEGRLTAGQLWSLDPEREWVLQDAK